MVSKGVGGFGCRGVGMIGVWGGLPKERVSEREGWGPMSGGGGVGPEVRIHG